MTRTILGLCSPLLAMTASVAQLPERNPFQAPVDLNEPALVINTAQQEAEPESEPEPEPLDLRATLLAGKRSSANLGGAIVSIGEEIAGYRLVSVQEGEAVLWKDGESIRLSVDNQNE